MSDRLKHVWEVELQAASGGTQTETVAAYWAPEHPGTDDAVRTAARTQAMRREGRDYQVIGDAVLVA